MQIKPLIEQSERTFAKIIRINNIMIALGVIFCLLALSLVLSPLEYFNFISALLFVFGGAIAIILHHLMKEHTRLSKIHMREVTMLSRATLLQFAEHIGNEKRSERDKEQNET